MARFESPRKLEYTFYIAAKDQSGNYSEPNEVTVQHPGINKLDLTSGDLIGFFNSIKIDLPTPQTVRSQTVYPEEETTERKKILGYRVYIYEGEATDRSTMLDEAEAIDYDVKEIENGTIVISGDSKTTYQVAVGCYDSAVHPDYNASAYENTISDFIEVSTSSIEPIDISEALIKPNELTETLNTPEEGIEEQITLMAGNYDEGISGGIGLKYTDHPDLGKGVDVQVVANRFRVFKEDDLEGTALFAVGDIDGTSQIFLNADEVAIYSGFENAEDGDGNSYDGLFELSDEGLQIDTPNFTLDKSVNAKFEGEVQSSQFSLTSGELTIDENGISSSEFNIDASDGSAEFSGDIVGATIDIGDSNFTVDADGHMTAVDGTFEGEFSALDGSIIISEKNSDIRGTGETNDNFILSAKDDTESTFDQNVEIGGWDSKRTLTVFGTLRVSSDYVDHVMGIEVFDDSHKAVFSQSDGNDITFHRDARINNGNVAWRIYKNSSDGSGKLNFKT